MLIEEPKRLLELIAVSLGGLMIGQVHKERGSQPEKPRVSRNLTKGFPASRESERSDLWDSWNGKETKPSSPNSSTNTFSTDSRRPKESLESKLRTSKNNSTEIIPLNGDSIRKYPPEYYKLNKKNQWLYRKSYSHSDMK